MALLPPRDGRRSARRTMLEERYRHHGDGGEWHGGDDRPRGGEVVVVRRYERPEPCLLCRDREVASALLTAGALATAGAGIAAAGIATGMAAGAAQQPRMVQ